MPPLLALVAISFRRGIRSLPFRSLFALLCNPAVSSG